MRDRRQDGANVVRKMLRPEHAETLENASQSKNFGALIDEIGFDCMYCNVWPRPGLDMRSRSLVTLGVMIALRVPEQIGIHVRAALRNGLTVNEIEEVIAQASGYAGFPAASIARSAAIAILKEDGLI